MLSQTCNWRKSVHTHIRMYFCLQVESCQSLSCSFSISSFLFHCCVWILPIWKTLKGSLKCRSFTPTKKWEYRVKSEVLKIWDSWQSWVLGAWNFVSLAQPIPTQQKLRTEMSRSPDVPWCSVCVAMVAGWTVPRLRLWGVSPQCPHTWAPEPSFPYFRTSKTWVCDKKRDLWE